VILFEIVGSEQHSVYQDLEIANGNRQYDFLRSIVAASMAVQRPFLSSHVIKAFNFQAITCLHTNAGEFRPCKVTVGTYEPPEHFRVQALMDDFVNIVNRIWETTDALALAAFVLWRLNHIHPFINGNGRTARAASYFVLCVKLGTWLPGATILPELLRRERVRYVDALQKGDASLLTGTLDLSELHALMSELLEEQIKSASPPGGEAEPVDVPLLPAAK
jgi:fido (protein-threonine AMPylation protein)